MSFDVKINQKMKEQYYSKGYWTKSTLLDIWMRNANKNLDSIYVTDDHGFSYTYDQADKGSDRIAAWLLDKGISAGDVVTVQFPIWAQFVLVYLAIVKIGAVIQPIAYNSGAEELAYVMNVVESKAYIAPYEHRKRNYVGYLDLLLDKVKNLSQDCVLLLNRDAEENNSSCKYSDFNYVINNYRLIDESEYVHVDSDSVACILSTSGTTGLPKQAMLTHNNIIFSEKTFIKALNRSANDVMFMASPLNHATGFFHGLISPMILGSSVILQQDFCPTEAIELLNKYSVTWTMGATPFVQGILCALDEMEATIKSLEVFVCGGAPVPSEYIEESYRHGFLLCECYGSTESCPHALVPPKYCLEWDGKYSGLACEGVEIKVVDRLRDDCPPGVEGEEASRGPHAFVGYLNNKEATDKDLDEDGWFYSGDLCVMDNEGRIKITGRIKDIIIRGGENISSVAVDNAVLGWNQVKDFAAVGMPDYRFGERICLFYVSKDDIVPNLDDLKEFLTRKNVPKRYWPEHLEPIDVIPRTKTGKIQRHKLSTEIKKRVKLKSC